MKGWKRAVVTEPGKRRQEVGMWCMWCMHVKGRGILHTVRSVAEALRSGEYAFVYRTDIRGYYRHIRKQKAMEMAERHVSSPVLRDLIRQYLWYSTECGGEIHKPATDICRGCALSPLVGASVLWHTDEHFNACSGLFYARYMDDFLFLTTTRHRLRRCVKELYEWFEIDGYERHPDKTQIRRISRGFDWTGVWFSHDAPG